MSDKEKPKKRKEYRNDPQDVLTVLVVFAVIGLACALGTYIQKNPEILIQTGSANPRSKEYEQAKQYSNMIVIIIGVVSTAIIAVFIGSLIKRRKKRERELQRRRDSLRELEEARRRVEEARKRIDMQGRRTAGDGLTPVRRYSPDEDTYNSDNYDRQYYSGREIRGSYRLGDIEDIGEGDGYRKYNYDYDSYDNDISDKSKSRNIIKRLISRVRDAVRRIKRRIRRLRNRG